MHPNSDYIWVFSGANLKNKVILRVKLCFHSVPYAKVWHAAPWKRQSNADSNSCEWPSCSLFTYSYRYLFKFLQAITVLSSTQNGFPARTLMSTAGIMTYNSQTRLSKQWFYKTYLEAPQPFFPLFVIISQVICYTCHYLIWLHTGLQISRTIAFSIQPSWRLSWIWVKYSGWKQLQKGDDMLLLPFKSCINPFHFLLFYKHKQCCIMELYCVKVVINLALSVLDCHCNKNNRF